jgi:hypothetical protein
VHAILGVSSFVVYSPAKHVLHSPFPVSSCHCPLWQFRHTVAPDKEYVPAAHVGSHVDAVVAAVTVEYLPGSHDAHEALPVDDLYLPGTQAVHGPPCTPVYPALQMQLARVPLASGEYEFDGQSPHVFDVAPTVVEYFPAPQFVHRAFPVTVLYLPSAQFTQSPPSGPVEPALHLQSAFAPLLSSEYEFDGQSPHVFDVAPTAVEYFPSPQFVHRAVPVTVLYLPAAHDVHGPPLLPVAPALQIQLFPVPLFSTDWEFVGQFSHDTYF